MTKRAIALPMSHSTAGIMRSTFAFWRSCLSSDCWMKRSRLLRAAKCLDAPLAAVAFLRDLTCILDGDYVRARRDTARRTWHSGAGINAQHLRTIAECLRIDMLKAQLPGIVD